MVIELISSRYVVLQITRSGNTSNFSRPLIIWVGQKSLHPRLVVLDHLQNKHPGFFPGLPEHTEYARNIPEGRNTNLVQPMLDE